MQPERKLDDVLLTGEAREEAVAAVCKQVEAWGLTLPDVAPFPLDFGLGRFHEVGETEFWLANEVNAGYCAKFLFVFDGQTCPYHHHKIKHETFFVLKGEVTMCIDGRDRVLRQGDRLVMPPGVKHSFTGRGPALLLEASMPSMPRDSFFDDKRIGDSGLI